jgi:hypothetical protein
MFLAAELGARWGRIFGGDADQILYDPDQAIAILVHILIEFVFERNIASYENSSFLGATRKPRVSAAR